MTDYQSTNHWIQTFLDILQEYSVPVETVVEYILEGRFKPGGL